MENLQWWVCLWVIGNCGNAAFLFMLCWKKTWNYSDKTSRGYSSLERDNQSSEPDKTQYLFMCCKQYSWKPCQISCDLGRVTSRVAVLLASVWVHNILWIKKKKKKRVSWSFTISSKWCQVEGYWVSGRDFFQSYQFLWVFCRNDGVIVCVPVFQGPVL